MSVWKAMTDEAPAPPYAIRPAHDLAQLRQLACVFRAVFKMPDLAAPPAWLMEDTVRAGGLALGLWCGEEPVGVSYAFPGVEGGEPYLYSDGLGILPAHRARGFAYELKLAQRRHALRLGYARIVWTFSALRSSNAHLYLTRLGAVATRYLHDRRGALEADWGTEGGVPFDEFLVEWRLNDERVVARLGGAPVAPLAGAPVVTRCEGVGLEVVLARVEALPSSDRIAVEVAPDYQALVDRLPRLARDWHEKTRPLFSRLLACGWRLVECERDVPSGRMYYLFERAAT